MAPLVVEQTPDLWLSPTSTSGVRRFHQETIPHRLLVVFDQSSGRFDHLDLNLARQVMSPRDYQFFVTFAGADTMGFSERDFEGLEDFYSSEE